MDWIVLSPFTRKEDPEWIFEYIPDSEHSVKAVPATYYHDRSRQNSSGKDWLDYLLHGVKGFFKSYSGTSRTGIITAFPQLALVVALLKKLTRRSNLPLIAWCFNLARPYDGIKGVVASFCLSSVDVFVVHSREEIKIYSKWLNLPESKFVFVHLSAEKPKGLTWEESEAHPYIVSLGTANRDYALLVAAVKKLGYKTIIVAGKYATDKLVAPDCVSFMSNLTLEECHEMAVHARINIIPISDVTSPSGQVTVIESMMMGIPLVATECAGTSDYIENHTDGLLVKPSCVDSMVNAIEYLWKNRELREKFSNNAKISSIDKFSFKAASRELLKIMSSFK
jgi:glycosyltransferase involved in cell wall biosynthesis